MLVFLHRGSDSDAIWAVCDPSVFVARGDIVIIVD